MTRAASSGSHRTRFEHLRWLLPLLPVAVLALVESVLRLQDRPRGCFDGQFRLMAIEKALADSDYVYLHQPDQVVPMEMFRIYEYFVHTNRLGLRGRETGFSPEPGVFRIVCVGDSVTDGKYVSDPFPFPGQMDTIYQEAGRPIEVLNVGEGGASIYRELQMLQTIALRLKPSLVLLTFVTNDVSDLERGERELVGRLREFSVPPSDPGWQRFLFTRTAIGELGLQWAIHLFTSRARREEARFVEQNAQDQSAAAVEEQGTRRGHEFAENSRKFMDRVGLYDRGVLVTPWDERTERLYSEYCDGLGWFLETAASAGVPIALAFVPAYPQIHEDRPNTQIQERLTRRCAELEIPFLDLTPAMRKHRQEVLDYAPLDYHFNRRGNRVIAEGLVEILDHQRLVPPP